MEEEQEEEETATTVFEIMEDFFLFILTVLSLFIIFWIVDDVLPNVKVGMLIVFATFLLIPCFDARVAGEKQPSHFLL